MSGPRRRDLFALAGAAASVGLNGAAAAPRAGSRADLERYAAFGIKASGSPGDAACGGWIERELAGAGLTTTRIGFDAPFFDVRTATLATDGATATVVPQAIVVPTGAAGVAGRLVRVAPGLPLPPLAGAIALVDLPHARWSSALAKPVRDTVAAAIRAGARAAVLVTNGPTGEAIALNADGRSAMFDRPVAILAPKDAAPFLAAAQAGATARLIVDGRGGRRPAFNIVARADRGRGRWVIVSTPRSGWTTCAGERGGGVAAFLALARWSTAALPHHDLAFVCNSGHEYEYLGAEVTLRDAIPAPRVTDLWLHLGANVAARDWHEIGGRLAPLATPDPQRVLAVSAPLLAEARAAFAGQPGLEAAYDVAAFSAGELANVVAAGYAPAVGIFGTHRFHHVTGDDRRCLDPAATDRVIESLKRLVLRSLSIRGSNP